MYVLPGLKRVTAFRHAYSVVSIRHALRYITTSRTELMSSSCDLPPSTGSLLLLLTPAHFRISAASKRMLSIWPIHSKNKSFHEYSSNPSYKIHANIILLVLCYFYNVCISYDAFKDIIRVTLPYKHPYLDYQSSNSKQIKQN